MDYHKDITKVSKSGLDQIAKSPLHYWERYLNPQHVEKKTAALTFGSAFHCRILEPSEWGKRYAIAPSADRRTKEGKEIWANFQERYADFEIISRDEDYAIERMSDAIWRHPQASLILSKLSITEQVFTHEDMKCKPDGITSLNIVLDLKTTDDASPYAFGRSAAKYRYDVQAALYTDILEANGQTVEAFVFIAIEKTAPYAVAVYVIEDEDIAKGREKYIQNLQTWRECKETNKWPGYTMGKLMMPNYGK